MNMNLENIDRTTIKEIIKEVLKDDINIFKDAVKEILIENKVLETKEHGKRRDRLKKMIGDDFDKYDDVFKELA